MSPRQDRKVNKKARLMAAVSESDLALFEKASAVDGAAVSAWLRVEADRAARAGWKPTKGSQEKTQDPRATPLSVHVTDQQAEVIKAAADAAGVTVSDYLRAAGRARASALGVK